MDKSVLAEEVLYWKKRAQDAEATLLEQDAEQVKIILEHRRIVEGIKKALALLIDMDDTQGISVLEMTLLKVPEEYRTGCGL